VGRVVGEVFMVCDVNVGGDCTGQGLDSGYKVCWAVVKGRTARRVPTAGWGRSWGRNVCLREREQDVAVLIRGWSRADELRLNECYRKDLFHCSTK